MKFNEKIQLLRKKHYLSQEEFGEKVGVSRQSVYKWEAGQSYPDAEKLLVISRIFDISIDYLMKDEITDPNSEASKSTFLSFWTPARKRKLIAYLLLLFDALAYGIMWVISRIWPQVYLELNYFENDPDIAYPRTGVSGLIYSKDLFGLVVLMVIAAVIAAALLLWNCAVRKGWIKKCADGIITLDKTKLNINTSVFDDAKEFPFTQMEDSEQKEK